MFIQGILTEERLSTVDVLIKVILSLSFVTKVNNIFIVK
jgi:hypothetical protein